MFRFFRRRRVKGDIAILGLQDWWFSSFSEQDREWMADTYAPMIGRARPLVEGDEYFPKPEPFAYLSNAATWFNKEGYRHCAFAFLEKSMEFCTDDIPVLDRHFALAAHCKVFYRWRDVEPGALDRAIAACEKCISFHEEAALVCIEKWGSLPVHYCFNQLRIIEEKRGEYDRAIELCEVAKARGWNGDWDKDIRRIRRKLAKSGRPNLDDL